MPGIRKPNEVAVAISSAGVNHAPEYQATIAVNRTPRQKGYTMETWLMNPAVALRGVVIGKLLYELTPAAWKKAAARVENDTAPDGAIDD
jgi:hypothetical protein